MPNFRASSWSVLLARDYSQLPRVATFEQVLVTAPPSDGESIERLPRCGKSPGNATLNVWGREYRKTKRQPDCKCRPLLDVRGRVATNPQQKQSCTAWVAFCPAFVAYMEPNSNILYHDGKSCAQHPPSRPGQRVCGQIGGCVGQHVCFRALGWASYT